MPSGYPEEDFLMLSGIQHIAFCERQFALIHLERQWAENSLTVQGRHVHEHADDPFENDTRGDLRITRSVPVESVRLGLRGIADVVEYTRDDDLPANESLHISGKNGKWGVSPIEYKRGRPKPNDADEVQLCAQAICLEEMLKISIKNGYLYYNSIKRRVKVDFDDNLRSRVELLSRRMHEMIGNGVVPRAIKKSYCNSCSLYDVCQPGWTTADRSVENYLKSHLSDRYDGAG
ncbi:CRISPR-associated protein Cas4 [uncultured archaeon]|nr:CRISPR-associated protein Cas4 [uncultured archaeon]